MCYYGPDDVDDDHGSYWATYAVYRRMGSGDDVRYERVSEMFRAIRTIERFTRFVGAGVDGVIVEGGFNCYDDSIDTGNLPLTVQAGDISQVHVSLIPRIHCFLLIDFNWMLLV